MARRGRAARAGRAEHGAGPGPDACCARRCQGSRRCRCGCLPCAGPARPALPDAPNARLVEWVSYEQAMPRADLVVCHAGHGTLATALAWGAPVVTVPAAGDMAENGARAQWAGAGLNLPGRFLSADDAALDGRARARAARRCGARARELAGWARTHDGAEAAARLVERFAGASYSSLPILKILVPQSGQVPWIAGRPFFMVTCFGSWISTFFFSFTQ